MTGSIAEPQIRLAQLRDLPHIATVDSEAFSPYRTAEDPQVFADHRAVFPEGFIVLELAGTIIGYGCSEKWAEARVPALGEPIAETHDPGGRFFCITGMAVRTAYWHQGYSTALLRSLLQIARRQGCRVVRLETTHAQGFYHKFGFRVIGETWQNGVALTIMDLDL